MEGMPMQAPRYDDTAKAAMTVQTALDRLDVELDQLEATIDMLRSRLSPVLRDEPIQARPGADEVDSSSAVGRKAQRLNRLTRQLGDVIQLLDI